MFPVSHGITAEKIHGAVLRRAHQPGAGIFWDTGLGPLLKGGHQGVLRQVFGQADAETLVIGWGSTYGAIRAAVTPGKEEGAWDLECVLQEEMPQEMPRY